MHASPAGVRPRARFSRIPIGPALLSWGILALAAGVARADWPQFLGPTRDGVVPGPSPVAWPDAGPSTLWKVEVGRGFSGPVVVGGRVLLHHRRGNEEVLEAFDAGTGKSAWRSSQPTAYEDDFGFDDGPRGTPAVAGGKVFTFGAEGRLTCTTLEDGAPKWTRPLGKELGADKGFFGFACSPLVASNRVIVQVGGRDGAGVVALDAATGATVWKATSDEAGYASPVLVQADGAQRVVVLNRAGVRVLDPRDGKVTAAVPFRSRQGASVNAATPLASADGVLVTASYDTGATWLRWRGGGDLGAGWHEGDALSAHISTPVRKGGLVFGFHGRQEQGAELRCIRVADGSVAWSSPRLGVGSVLVQGERLWALVEGGELILAEATDSGWKELARAQVLGSGVRAAPAMDAGVLYARDKARLVAIRVGVPK